MTLTEAISRFLTGLGIGTPKTVSKQFWNSASKGELFEWLPNNIDKEVAVGKIEEPSALAPSMARKSIRSVQRGKS